MNNKIPLFSLFLSYAKVGALTFGGGYAMLPVLRREMVERTHLVTDERMMDAYALSQTLPGIIAVNTGVQLGYDSRGTLGGIVAGLGVAFPSLVIIMLIAAFVSNFTHIEWVNHAFAGIRVSVMVEIINTIRKMAGKALTSVLSWILFLIALGLSLFTPISPVLIVAGSAAFGLAASVVCAGR